MSALEIVAILIILLVIIPIILKIRKKCSSKETLISKPKAQEPIKQQPGLKPDDSPLGNAEPQTNEATIVSPPELIKPISNIEPSVKLQINETMVSSPENNSSLPQDSILRRHYLTHLCTMIEALVPTRPTDAVLCRHYDAMIVAKMDRCLNDKKAMEQLIDDYKNNKPIDNIEAFVTPQASETTVSSPENNDSLPQDSIQKRHYLCAMIEALAPPRPTDAVLCRHYDTMIVAKIDQCLNDKKAIEQLVYDYENLSA